jgi:predicted nuclease with TOPRIM domain
VEFASLVCTLVPAARVTLLKSVVAGADVVMISVVVASNNLVDVVRG